MISILDHLHKYVPTLTSTETVAAPHTNAPVTVIADHFHHVLFGGDMVTAKRARGAQGIRENSNRGKDRLEGLVPIVEDWHAKMTLICVSTITCSNVMQAVIFWCLILISLMYRLSGSASTSAPPVEMLEHSTTFEM